MNSAPHIIWPLRFILPYEKGIRPAWLVRLGLFLYDHLAPRKKLPGTETIKLTRHPAGQALKPGFDTAFVYSDCWVEDSRMVALNAIDAFEKGADIRVRTKLVSARRDGDVWVASLQNVETGETQDVRARVIVNAGGPFVADVLNAKLGLNTKKNVRLVKGSHIVVPKLFDTKEAFILQNTDKRIVFAIPYQEKFTLIGTTDIPVEAVPDKKVTISDDEIQYLCNVVNHFFKQVGDAGGRGLDLFRRASAFRRRLLQRLRRDPRLRVRHGCAAGPGAGAVDLRRQDHHLPQARRARPRRAEDLSSRP